MEDKRKELMGYACLLAEKIRRLGPIDYTDWADDPVGFIEGILCEYLPPDLKLICESVLHNQVTIAQSGNGTGKTWIVARIATWFFLCRKQPKVYCAAAPPLSNLDEILWAEIANVYNGNFELFGDVAKTARKISRSALEFIRGVTIPASGTDEKKQASFSGKHAPSLLFALDEGDAIPDPVHVGIETCLSGGFDREVISFNPRARVGAVYRMIKQGIGNVIKLSAFNHPNVITGNNIVDGAVTREKTVIRISQWTRPIADNEPKDKYCFELPEFLEGCIPVNQKNIEQPALVPGWYKIEDHRFSHVVLGEYPAEAENQLINEEWLDAAVSRYEQYTAKRGTEYPKLVRCHCGLDIADGGRDNTVLAPRFGLLLHPLIVWEDDDVIEVGDKVAAHVEDIPILASINCDGTGVGAGVAPYLSRKYKLPTVKVMVESSPVATLVAGEFRRLQDQLMWEMRMWLKDEKAMIPPDQELIEELLAYTHDVVKGKKTVSSAADVQERISRHPDKSKALMFSFMRAGSFSNANLD